MYKVVYDYQRKIDETIQSIYDNDELLKKFLDSFDRLINETTHNNIEQSIINSPETITIKKEVIIDSDYTALIDTFKQCTLTENDLKTNNKQHLKNILARSNIDHKQEIIKQNIKDAHIYCKINNLSGQLSGPIT